MNLKYKFGDECTGTISERNIILPEGISIRRGASNLKNETNYRIKLVENLQTSLNLISTSQDDSNKMINKEVSSMTEENSSQIIIMRHGNVFVNTQEHGLMKFNIETLK